MVTNCLSYGGNKGTLLFKVPINVLTNVQLGIKQHFVFQWNKIR